MCAAPGCLNEPVTATGYCDPCSYGREPHKTTRRVATPETQLLRDVRRDHKVSLKQLQQATGINRAILSRIEQGRLVPTAREQRLIAACLGLDAALLATRTYLVVEEPAT